MGRKINYRAWGFAPWVFWQWDCRRSRREPKNACQRQSVYLLLFHLWGKKKKKSKAANLSNASAAAKRLEKSRMCRTLLLLKAKMIFFFLLRFSCCLSALWMARSQFAGLQRVSYNSSKQWHNWIHKKKKKKDVCIISSTCALFSLALKNPRLNSAKILRRFK